MRIPSLTRTVGRRIPGQRALQTRQQLVGAVIELLAENPYRSVTVMQVARAAGTSPATFYEYFESVDEVVLDVVGPLADKTAEQLADFADGSWASEGVYGATRFVEAVRHAWSDHRVVMRILMAVAAENDPRFVQAYRLVTDPVVRALRSAAEPNMPSPDMCAAMAHSLVTMLASAAAHKGADSIDSYEKWARREGLSHIVYTSVTTVIAY
ncbi:TetR/AcrR family transcriptional regulator [Streptomyces sp. NPDC001407]|uniref:TetR/AcrR family transcriptional regulator n=1 Tax=Streptomyces sp. NPDC001407 TaxID=3364573 RepID=UPI0036B0E386